MTISSESRYQEADINFAFGHTYDVDGVTDLTENTNLPDVVTRHTLYMLNTLPLPDPPDTEYMFKSSDTIYNLAFQYLNDPKRWWLIADANPQVRYPMDLKMGDVIRMPD